MHTIDLLHIQFKFELAPHKVEYFKKPVSAAISDLRKKGVLNGINTDLFYNRDEETGNTENRYPLIQFRSIDGFAAITGINEGAEVLHQFFEILKDYPGSAKKHLYSKINTIDLLDYRRPRPEKFKIQVLPRKKKYIITDWLPLDSVRYNTWAANPELRILAEMLDECLPRQIGRLLAGVGFHHPVPFIAQNSLVLSTYPLQQVYKEKKLPFDCVFESNLDLPTGVGIGQVPGIGYGRIFPWDPKTIF